MILISNEKKYYNMIPILDKKKNSIDIIEIVL